MVDLAKIRKKAKESKAEAPAAAAVPAPKPRERSEPRKKKSVPAPAVGKKEEKAPAPFGVKPKAPLPVDEPVLDVGSVGNDDDFAPIVPPRKEESAAAPAAAVIAATVPSAAPAPSAVEVAPDEDDAEVAAAPVQPAVAVQKEYLLFTLARELYAVPIADVVEIVPYRPATPVPHTPDFVDGIISLRGRIVLVLDVRSRLGITRSSAVEGDEEERRLVIFDMEGEYLAVVVDSISQVVRFADTAVEPVGELFADVDTTFLVGVFDHGGKLVAMLDLERLTSWDLE